MYFDANIIHNTQAAYAFHNWIKDMMYKLGLDAQDMVNMVETNGCPRSLSLERENAVLKQRIEVLVRGRLK